MQFKRGFLLLELIAAVSLLGGFLLVIGQWWQHQQRLEHRQNWLQHTDYLLQAAERFWLEQGRPPANINELLSEQHLSKLNLPWQQGWQLTHDNSLLRWQITAPSSAQARWFAAQFHAAIDYAEVVIISQWAPLAQADDEHYLHRIARPDRPHLNQLASDLSMDNHSVVGIGNLIAQQGSLMSLTSNRLVVDAAQINSLQTHQLTAAQVITPMGDLQQLVNRIDAYAALWQACLDGGGCQ